MSDSEEEFVEKQFKILLVGGPQVGKTSLAAKYAQGTFTKKYVPTIGVEFYIKRTILPEGRHVTLKIWDVEGSALGGKMLDKYVYGANAILFVYDVTNIDSMEDLEQWLVACRSVNSNYPPIMALVANKTDLEHLRVIKSDKHHKFAQENQLLTFAISAKTGDSVNLCFQKISAELLGIRLSKAEQEHQQPVVKAEICSYSEDRLPLPPQTSTVKTSVCSIQ